MPCEKYQNALIDLAAASVDPAEGAQATVHRPARFTPGSAGILSASLNFRTQEANEIRVHLNTCAPCRSYLEQEQLLFASIDSAVRQAANAPLQPALLHRFQARLTQQDPPQPALSPSWIYAGAGLATAALLLLVLLPSLTHDANQLAVVPVAVRQQTVGQPESLAQSAPRSLASMPVRHARKSTSGPPKPSEPEVLVPPDERIAFERFLSDLNGREDLAIALVKPMQAQRQPHTTPPPLAIPAPLEVPDIETAALIVQPLSEIADR